MFGAKWLSFSCLLIASIFIFSPAVSAFDNQPVISHIKTGETGILTSEFIAIYNNSDLPIDITGWCLVYSSASDITKNTLSCLNPPTDNTALMLTPYGYARFSSLEFANQHLNFVADEIFSSGLSGTSGHIRLFDISNIEIDKVGWGSAVSPESQTVTAPVSGKLLQRKLLPETMLMQDTNINFDDFTSETLGLIPASGIYEEIIEIDVCTNIDDMQTSMPDDYYPGEDGSCQQDQCDNMPDLQAQIPEGHESLDGINCTQKIVIKEDRIITITELLPNASSVDTGKEYIELFNPNPQAVDLAGYRLELGPTYSKYFVLTKQLLNPFSYTTFSDILSGLTLPNSSASVRLIAPNGSTVSETDTYENPKDDQAWSFINEVWQFTINPTPGLANLPSSSEVAATADNEELADCGPGKYRNPETNRCRNIETGDVELRPCAEGQLRNQETNRCRSATSADGLVPCKEGQERNPETNRCRNIVSTASTLKPCDPGEERNPETNRCRKTAALGASTMADVQDLPAETRSTTNWWVLGGVLAAAGGYGLYEWRNEIIRGFSAFRIKK